jgi:hypothetical protein
VATVSEFPEDLVYRYDPTPALGPGSAGVTKGYIYLWSGEPGPAQVAPAHLLQDDDGSWTLVGDWEWEPCTVVDDSEGQ